MDTDFEKSEAGLIEIAKLSAKDQQSNKTVAIELFNVFWRSNPTQAQFGKVCKGLVIQPEMLWAMVRLG